MNNKVQTKAEQLEAENFMLKAIIRTALNTLESGYQSPSARVDDFVTMQCFRATTILRSAFNQEVK